VVTVPAVGDEIGPVEWCPDSLDLFLYSAAVWLPHRIHYDKDYALAEGHPGILIQGPLQGAHLSQMVYNWAHDFGGRIRSIRYRLVSAATANTRLACRGRIVELRRWNECEVVIHCELWVERKTNGERTATGKAGVTIPAKS
jgi:3-methylfumaryl-CoA hydratase